VVPGHQGPLLHFSKVFIAEEVNGVRDKGPGDTTMVDADALLKAFLDISLRAAHFIDKAFIW
jgi:hypothetical protein